MRSRLRGVIGGGVQMMPDLTIRKALLPKRPHPHICICHTCKPVSCVVEGQACDPLLAHTEDLGVLHAAIKEWGMDHLSQGLSQ